MIARLLLITLGFIALASGLSINDGKEEKSSPSVQERVAKFRANLDRVMNGEQKPKGSMMGQNDNNSMDDRPANPTMSPKMGLMVNMDENQEIVPPGGKIGHRGKMGRVGKRGHKGMSQEMGPKMGKMGKRARMGKAKRPVNPQPDTEGQDKVRMMASAPLDHQRRVFMSKDGSVDIPEVLVDGQDFGKDQGQKWIYFDENGNEHMAGEEDIVDQENDTLDNLEPANQTEKSVKVPNEAPKRAGMRPKSAPMTESPMATGPRSDSRVAADDRALLGSLLPHITPRKTILGHGSSQTPTSPQQQQNPVQEKDGFFPGLPGLPDLPAVPDLGLGLVNPTEAPEAEEEEEGDLLETIKDVDKLSVVKTLVEEFNNRDNLLTFVCRIALNEELKKFCHLLDFNSEQQ